MAEAGIVLVDGAGLMNSSHGTRISLDGAGVTVTDGPFAETSELVAGYAVWDVKDMDEAIAWGKRWPTTTSGRSEIEIRPSPRPRGQKRPTPPVEALAWLDRPSAAC